MYRSTSREKVPMLEGSADIVSSRVLQLLVFFFSSPSLDLVRDLLIDLGLASVSFYNPLDKNLEFLRKPCPPECIAGFSCWASEYVRACCGLVVYGRAFHCGAPGPKFGALKV